MSPRTPVTTAPTAPAPIRMRIFHYNTPITAMLFGYRAGHAVTEVYAYDEPATCPATPDEDLLEEAFRLFNVGDEALEQYPVLDEHTLTEVETQIQEQAWAERLFGEVSTDLRDLAPAESDDEVDGRAGAIAGAEPAIRAAYYDYAGEHGQWLHHGVSSVSHSHHSDAVRHVGATVLGWPL